MKLNMKALEICPTTTQKRIKSGALLVDVREREEIEQLSFDVSEIMHIPLSEFEERFNEIPRDREVIMVCRGGGRSLKATYYLMNHGYINVKNMQYGIVRWMEKGFPTKGSTESLQTNHKSSGCCGPSSDTKTSTCCDDSPNSDGSSCC